MFSSISLKSEQIIYCTVDIREIKLYSVLSCEYHSYSWTQLVPENTEYTFVLNFSPNFRFHWLIITNHMIESLWKKKMVWQSYPNADKAQGEIRTKTQGSNLSVNPADCADPFRSSLTCAHGHHTMLLIHC